MSGDTQAYSSAGAKGNVRSALGIPPEALVIGHVGRFDANKRQVDLVEAFRLFQRLVPTAHLILIGKGPLLESVRESATQVRHVHFLPRVTDVAAFLRELDIFVLCSRHEGLPRALLEAMATGRAVIATRTGGIPELLETSSEPCGLLVPIENPQALAEALMQLSRVELRTALGLAARRQITNQFSFEGTFSSYESLYCSLFQRGPL
jgi:glycosyltransferase involved in cell wall biosynthesis